MDTITKQAEIEEEKPADILAWASMKKVWLYPHDVISNQIVGAAGPSRERIRDSLGSTLENGEEIMVSFQLDATTLTLPEFDSQNLTDLWVKGVVNCLRWIKDSRSNFLPRNCCLIELIRPQVRGRWKGGRYGSLYLHHSSIWHIYDTSRRAGRVLRIDG